jgi:hypothetical protein
VGGDPIGELIFGEVAGGERLNAIHRIEFMRRKTSMMASATRLLPSGKR